MKYLYISLVVICVSCKTIKAKDGACIESNSNVVYYINGKPVKGNVGKTKSKNFKKMIKPIQ